MVAMADGGDDSQQPLSDVRERDTLQAVSAANVRCHINIPMFNCFRVRGGELSTLSRRLYV